MIEAIPEHVLTEADETQIAALLRQCFPTNFGGRSFYQQRPTLRLVWREGGILGHVALFCRAVRLDGELTDILGLGDIATDPQARGWGIGTALVQRALETGSAPFAVLFGARTLYDRAGFKPVANPYLHVDMTGARTQAVVRRNSQFLKVRARADRPWPEGAEVDFLGSLF
ncbi:GNAT family N-acetyltransferase [Maliponia aquimaris]|uniref:N-acetyltransferase domain-containing protein n=1 Tax=Maliponia aquimaris TaxID=1673631 RepID=A0A238JQN3_9RHOB|nr:GNAT family N-acetyltransferase [Maliponia aquimaris]SMX32162.1 hypothetical protein MAA8898_00165 [Maliponia aquimaris]